MSIASQAIQQKFPFQYDAVFDGLVTILPAAGMIVTTKNKVIGRINACGGMSLFSSGKNITLVVEKIDDSHAVVGVESSLKPGAIGTDVHRHRKKFNKIIYELSRHLQRQKA
jgi:ammonia channel protein AmtB